MQVNLCVKKPNPSVKYNLSNPIIIDESVIINDVNFQEVLKEVRHLPKKKLNKYKQTIQTFLMTSVPFLILPLRSMASELNPSVPVGTTLPQTATGMPPELLELLLMILKISVGGAVILSAITLVFAGVLRMFRKRKEANEWTVDILKSLVQILVAVPVVFLIYYVSTLLFGGSTWHINPF